MRTTRMLTAGLLGATVTLLAAGAAAADAEWHKTLEDGVTAARKSGKPLLVVTAWRSGI